MPPPASDAITVPRPTRRYTCRRLSSVRTGEYGGDVVRGSVGQCSSNHRDTVAPAATATCLGKEYPSLVLVWPKSGREKSGRGKSHDCDSVAPMSTKMSGQYGGDVARGSVGQCSSDHCDTVVPAAKATCFGKEYPLPLGVLGKSGREKSGGGGVPRL